MPVNNSFNYKLSIFLSTTKAGRNFACFSTIVRSRTKLRKLQHYRQKQDENSQSLALTSEAGRNFACFSTIVRSRTKLRNLQHYRQKQDTALDQFMVMMQITLEYCDFAYVVTIHQLIRTVIQRHGRDTAINKPPAKIWTGKQVQNNLFLE